MAKRLLFNPGDKVITIDGGIGIFMFYKMDDNYCIIEFDNAEFAVYHVDQIKKW